MRLVWKREAHQERLAGCLGQDIVGQMSPSSIKKKTTSPVCGGKLSGFVVLLRLVTHPISCPSSRRRPTAARPRAARRPHATWPRLVGVRDMCLICWRPNPHPTHAGPHPPPLSPAFPNSGRARCSMVDRLAGLRPHGQARSQPAAADAVRRRQRQRRPAAQGTGGAASAQRHRLGLVAARQGPRRRRRQ